MYLMYYMDEAGQRVYTLEVSSNDVDLVGSSRNMCCRAILALGNDSKWQAISIELLTQLSASLVTCCEPALCLVFRKGGVYVCEREQSGHHLPVACLTSNLCFPASWLGRIVASIRPSCGLAENSS